MSINNNFVIPIRRKSKKQILSEWQGFNLRAFLLRWSHFWWKDVKERPEVVHIENNCMRFIESLVVDTVAPVSDEKPYHIGKERKIRNECLYSLSFFIESCFVQDLFRFYSVFILLIPEFIPKFLAIACISQRVNTIYNTP